MTGKDAGRDPCPSPSCIRGREGRPKAESAKPTEAKRSPEAPGPEGEMPTEIRRYGNTILRKHDPQKHRNTENRKVVNPANYRAKPPPRRVFQVFGFKSLIVS